MLYFYGQCRIDGEMQFGCFEYFINSYGTLFHRMFRIYDALPVDVKISLENNWSSIPKMSKQIDMINSTSSLMSLNQKHRMTHKWVEQI